MRLWIFIFGVMGIATAVLRLSAAQLSTAEARVWTSAPARLAMSAYLEPEQGMAQRLLAALPQWRRDRRVPPILLEQLPQWDDASKDAQLRKRRFVSVILPSVLTVNRMLLRDRERLKLILAKQRAREDLSPYEAAWLNDMLRHYKLEDGDAEDLLARVDILPPSLIMAQAAIESGWGTSRFAREGNALFGQWTDGDEGLLPKRRRAGATHRIKAFDNLASSVYGYLRNINTHRAYRELRGARARMREQGSQLHPYELARHLGRYSELDDVYVGRVHDIIRVNRLTDFDHAEIVAANL